MNSRKIMALVVFCITSTTITVIAESESRSKVEATRQAKWFYKNQNYPLAFQFARNGDMDDPELLYLLGKMYYSGKGTEKDLTKAFPLFKRAADKGNVQACRIYATMYLIGQKKYREALPYLKKAAEAKESHAMYAIGWMYENGLIDGRKNLPQAEFWYRKSIEDCEGKPFPMALVQYGYKLKEKEPDKARLYWQMAEQQHYAAGAMLLGYAYQFAQVNLNKDYKKALEFHNKIFDSKYASTSSPVINAKSLSMMIEIYRSGGFGVEHSCSNALEAAKRLLSQKKAPKNEIANAWYTIGNIFSSGCLQCNYTKNYKQAFEAYENAAKNGSARALIDLGIMYANGEYVKKNISKALEYYQAGINQGCTYGYRYMANIYLSAVGANNNGMQRDEAKAEEYLLKGVQAKDVYAMLELAVLYSRQGKVSQAEKYFAAAAKYQGCRHLSLYRDIAAAELKKNGANIPKEAFADTEKTLREAIKNGDEEAMYHLAQYLDSGLLGYIDEKESQKLYSAAAAKGHCCANVYFALKKMFLADNIAHEEARLLLEKALQYNVNCPNALFAYASGCIMGFWGKPQDSLKYFQNAADSGHQMAMVQLVALSLFGKKWGIEKNPQVARKYIEMLKKSSSSDIKLRVEELEALWNVQKNEKKNGEKFFALANKLADNGRYLGYFTLAICYENGIGTQKDLPKAQEYFEKCKNFKGDPRIMNSLFLKHTKQSLIEAREIFHNQDKNVLPSEKISPVADEKKDMEYPHALSFPLGMVRGIGNIVLSPISFLRYFGTHPVSSITFLFIPPTASMLGRMGWGCLDFITFGYAGNHPVSQDFRDWPWECNCSECRTYWQVNNIKDKK